MESKVSLGLKLFKEENGEVSMIRIIKLYKNDSFKIKHCDTGLVEKIGTTLMKEYTPLEPDGVFTASVVTLKTPEGNTVKDVIVTGNRYLDTKLKISPYVMCRQNITDIFAELFCNKPTNDLVGLSVTRDNCPVNFDMKIMLAADSIEYHQLINIYRMDTKDDILEMLNLNKYDTVLSDLYDQHCLKSPIASMKDEDLGWCNSLETLLTSNNFWDDINTMFGILEVDFTLSDFFNIKTTPSGVEYSVLRDDARLWLSQLQRVNISEANVLEYDHDINLADFKNTRYLLIRDNTKKIYLVVYTGEGEFLEKDLEEKAKKLDFSTKFKINFYNKYKQINDNNI